MPPFEVAKLWLFVFRGLLCYGILVSTVFSITLRGGSLGFFAFCLRSSPRNTGRFLSFRPPTLLRRSTEIILEGSDSLPATAHPPDGSKTSWRTSRARKAEIERGETHCRN